jgi:lysosomal acid lipase/cholesteryl ester hydrolase
LTVLRIPGTNTSDYSHNAPVLFQHGILDSADAWIMNTPDVAPAFVASRAGYDVWLGNSRGNKYSLEHVSLKSEESEYWQFDWQNMGDGDDPAVIDYIRKVNGAEKVAYIAHSQGTT